MNAAEALREYAALLKIHGMDDAADEARCLICHVLKVNHAGFYSEPERELSNDEMSALKDVIGRRLCGEPAAYILNKREFYGLEFYVDRRVLVPRPETEILVETALDYCRSNTGRPLRAADVGTGSGAIAISIAMNNEDMIVYASDVSASALEVARINVCTYNLQERVKLIQGDLLEPLPVELDLIVANLPYIAENDLDGLPVEVSQYEPGIALNGGERGLQLIERLLVQSKNSITADGVIILEIGAEQAEEIFNKVKSISPYAEVELIADLLGIKRVVKISGFTFDIEE